MRPNAYLSLLLSLLLLAGCADRLEMPSVIDGGSDRPGQTVADGTPIDVPFSVNYSPMTRSSLTVGEDVVNNINIVAFKNGVRTTFVYTTPDSDITLQLVKGESYNIYAVANVGAISIPSSESDFLDYSYSIDGAADLNGGFPMCWKYEGFTAGVLTSPVDIELERLVAKVKLTMPQGEVSGYSVTSVRLCQAAGVIRPFAEGGSKAESASEVCSGDYATQSDLAIINGGGSIYFYTLENAQGTLIEGNTDPWNKVPDNMNGKDDVCTYIEITCEHDGSFLLDGTVTYRLYLGADNCSNFDVLRNKNYNLSLSTTYGGMNNDDISWKVDVDCEVSNAGDAGIQVGAHAEDDLYIGEVIVMGFSTSQAFDDYNGGEPFDCELVLVKNGVESDAAWFEEINDGGYNKSYDCVMHCVDEVSGAELYLKKDDQLICKLPFETGEKVNIQKPSITPSTTESTNNGFVNANIEHICPEINGADTQMYLYLTDSEGKNLNCSQQYYFDLSLFDDIQVSVSSKSSSLTTNLGALTSLFSSSSNIFNYLLNDYTVIDKPLTRMNLNIRNNGSINQATFCSELYVAAFSNNNILNWKLSSDKTEDCNINGSVDILEPYVVIFDDYTNGIFNGIGIYNPSGLQLTAEQYYYSKVNYYQNYGTRYPSSSVNATTKYFLAGNNPLNSNFKITGNSVTINPSDYYKIVSNTENPKGGTILPVTPNSFLPDIKLYNSSKTINTGWGFDGYALLDMTCKGTYIDFNLVYIDGCLDLTTGRVSSLGSSYYYDWDPAMWYITSNGAECLNGAIYINGAIYNTSEGRLLDRESCYCLTSTPIQISFNYTSTGVRYITTDPCSTLQNHPLKISLVPTMRGYYEWTEKSNGDTNGRNFFWNVRSFNNYLTITAAGTSTASIRSNIETDIHNLNISFWHTCCTNLIDNRNNRYSRFARIYDLSLHTTINCSSGLVPINFIDDSSGSSNQASGTFYWRTVKGTYCESSRTNPDGSSRGDEVIADYANKYSDYEVNNDYGVYKIYSGSSIYERARNGFSIGGTTYPGNLNYQNEEYHGPNSDFALLNSYWVYVE